MWDDGDDRGCFGCVAVRFQLGRFQSRSFGKLEMIELSRGNIPPSSTSYFRSVSWASLPSGGSRRKWVTRAVSDSSTNNSLSSPTTRGHSMGGAGQAANLDLSSVYEGITATTLLGISFAALALSSNLEIQIVTFSLYTLFSEFKPPGSVLFRGITTCSWFSWMSCVCVILQGTFVISFMFSFLAEVFGYTYLGVLSGIVLAVSGVSCVPIAGLAG